MTLSRSWLAFALLVAWAACDSRGTPGSRAPITGSWNDDRARCQRTLRARVAGNPGAKVRVLETTTEIGERGVVELSIPAIQVGDARSLTVEIDDGTDSRVEEIRVLEPVPWALDRIVETPPDPRFTGTVHVISGDRRVKYAVRGSFTDQGHITIPLPCGVVSGRADQGRLRMGERGPELLVPLLDVLLARTTIAESEPINLSTRIDLSRGRTAELTVAGTLDTTVVLARYRAAATAATPVPWAPAYRKNQNQPILALFADRPDVQMIGKAPVREVAAVALVTYRYERIGSCKNVERPGAEPIPSVPRYRTHADVTIHAASTGALIKKVAVEGNKIKRCPDTLTTEGFDEPSAVHPLPWGKIRLAIRDAAP